MRMFVILYLKERVVQQIMAQMNVYCKYIANKFAVFNSIKYSLHLILEYIVPVHVHGDTVTVLFISTF